MRLLVLGGTLFLGRHVAEAALARGYDVTLFSRGRTNPELFPDAEKLRGDRTSDLSALRGRSWDAVIDTSAFTPRVVRASAELLGDRVAHYAFVSSISVYADPIRPGATESAPVVELPEPAVEEVGPETYGGLKVLCERALERAMPGRALSVRAGLIVGSHDPTGRFTYWVRRIARGGEVLAPEPRGQRVQFIHARDLADWILDMGAARRAGVYNATGPATPLTMADVLEECRTATASDARLVWVEEEFLLEHGVEEWVDLPLWLAPKTHPEVAGMLAIDATRALDAGLRLRPLADTILDTLRGAAPASGAGLDERRERDLLAAWNQRAPT